MSSVGMKPSRKFANGTVHENGSGQFEIVDRFLEDGTIMLKYKWLNGEFEGQVDTNKEVNVNASIWKFQKVRGMTPSDREKKEDTDFMEEVRDAVQEGVAMVTKILGNQEFYADKLKEFLEGIEDIHRRMERGADQFKTLNQQIERQNAVIQQQNEYIHMIMNTLEDRMANQQNMMAKLIEKI